MAWRSKAIREVMQTSFKTTLAVKARNTVMERRSRQAIAFGNAPIIRYVAFWHFPSERGVMYLPIFRPTPQCLRRLPHSIRPRILWVKCHVELPTVSPVLGKGEGHNNRMMSAYCQPHPQIVVYRSTSHSVWDNLAFEDW